MSYISKWQVNQHTYHNFITNVIPKEQELYIIPSY